MRGRVIFGALSLWSRVYVDGRALKDSACGYAPIEVDVPAATGDERELLVVVDNRFDFQRVPMHEQYFDFYQYGGVIRPVALHWLPGDQCFIDALRVTPLAGYREGAVRLQVEIKGGAGQTHVLAVSFDGGPEQRVKLQADRDACATCEMRVPQPRVWSPDTPALHRVRVTLHAREGGGPVDGIETRFGLRRIEARDGALWLNGERLVLRGYNRHEWHPNCGPSTPVLQIYADLQLLRDLGCNFVRGSHYPQDQRFLDLCDELGFLVWEENLGWGQREQTFASARFREQHAGSLRAMLRASHNHPSVIMWGFLNEAATDGDAVRPVLEESVRLVRSRDDSRPLSYATMYPTTDKYLGLVDVISLNLYPGWYLCEGVDSPLELIGPHIQRCFEHIDAAGFADKPLIVSEIGAEALYGWRDPHRDFFTEEYQADYLRLACVEALSRSRCSGIALWQFSDIRTYGGGWSLKRPRTFNNKGTVDEYRRPKAAYAAVRSVFNAHRAGHPLIGATDAPAPARNAARSA